MPNQERRQIRQRLNPLFGLPIDGNSYEIDEAWQHSERREENMSKVFLMTLDMNRFTELELTALIDGLKSTFRSHWRKFTLITFPVKDQDMVLYSFYGDPNSLNDTQSLEQISNQIRDVMNAVVVPLDKHIKAQRLQERLKKAKRDNNFGIRKITF